MRNVDGETLEERVRRTGPLDLTTVLTVARQVTAALAAAENHGLVHRDLKPGNIMITTEKGKEKIAVKVIDFGVAKALTATPDGRELTHRGFVGTPAFASPEQFTGAPVDVRSDIYSLGATLWYVLSGHLPFGDRAGARPPPIEQLKAAHVPARLISLLVSMLAIEPAARPGIQDLAAKLEAIQKRSPRRRVLAVAGFLIFASAAAYSWHSFPAAPNPGVPALEKSIAVLPFENLSDDKENSYFAAGVQDELLTDLAKIADLKVIARTSVLGYAPNRNRDLREIGRALDVAYVLEGSVQQRGGQVRVSIQLLDTRTNTQVWAESYDRDLANVFAVQSDVALQITSELQVTLSPREKSLINEIPTQDLAAFDLYARAKTLRLTTAFGPQFKDRFLQTVELLNQAVARDPSFLQAWCELATAEDLLYFAGYDHTPARLALADTAVQTALRLRPGAGIAHLALARHLYQAYRAYDQARTELTIARRTLPNNAEALALIAYIDRRQERWVESTRNLERAIQLDPRNPFMLGQIAINYSYLRHYEKAAAVLDRLLAIEPQGVLTRVARAWVDFEWQADSRPLHATIEAILDEDPAASSTIAADWLFLALCERDFPAADRALASLRSDDALTLGHMFLSRAFGAGLLARVRGNAAAAQAAFAGARIQQAAAVRTQPGHAATLCVLGLVDADLGQKKKALREGRRAMELMPLKKDAFAGTDIIVAFAIICAWTGEKDLALKELATAAQNPGLINYGQLKLQPWWDPLRGDPRFEKIVASFSPQNAAR